MKKEPLEMIAEARAIVMTMKMGGLSYDKAKEKVVPILKEYNAIAKDVAKSYGRKWYDLTFSKLAR